MWQHILVSVCLRSVCAPCYRAWWYVTTQNLQSANGITSNPIQNNSVFIHSVPDCIVRAWWTEYSARLMCAVWHEYQSFSDQVKAASDSSNWDSKKECHLQRTWRWFHPILLSIKYAPLFGCTDSTLPHLTTRKMFYITDIKTSLNMLQYLVIRQDEKTQENQYLHRGYDKSLARPTSRCILFDGENISFDASLVIYINSTNIPPIMIINRMYEHQNLLSL
jgi:hypothetical protein